MEWIIIDDGSDKVEDLFTDISISAKINVKYFKYDEKMLLGKKRNLMHDKCSGDIIIYMDDDDYYPPTRVSHAVDTLLKNPEAMCAGSSEMHIYFKHIKTMYQFGPYKLNHSTAATFAFRKELLLTSRYDDNAALAEERDFLKNYTVPFVQLDTTHSILVFSHVHNSFDKRKLLETPNKYTHVSQKNIADFIKNENNSEHEQLQFFLTDIDDLLEKYEPGLPQHKPDVLLQMETITLKRNLEIQLRTEIRAEITAEFSNLYQTRMSEQNYLLNDLLKENGELKKKVTYLENKIKEVISQAIAQYKKGV